MPRKCDRTTPKCDRYPRKCDPVGASTDHTGPVTVTLQKTQCLQSMAYGPRTLLEHIPGHTGHTDHTVTAVTGVRPMTVPAGRRQTTVPHGSESTEPRWFRPSGGVLLWAPGGICQVHVSQVALNRHIPAL